MDTGDSGDEGPARPRRRGLPSRRSVLIAGASGLGLAGFAVATATDSLPFSPAVQRALGVASSSPATQLGATRVERVWSAARGREVELLTVLPGKQPEPGLPMSLLLHGLHGNARKSAPTGLAKQLSGEVARRAVPAFGFVAVDGGDHYWHQNRPGDDPMAMLLEEVPVWLRERGLGGPDGLPFACTGLSMGGFGALLYARRRSERRQPLNAIAALAPALMTSWHEMSKRRAFRDAADWASMDPLRNLDAIRGIPTGVWCGTEDGFIEGVRKFIADARPAVAHTARGKHGDAFNRTVVPSVISFLGKHVPGQHRK
ncbi:alpha/beta hydrolase [Amycolatopsis anabasis]|uniref:alpha/beta hydrolase n=1 Tax=Amycolatopsis anabasis TaxID=1840409 RepID=UPI00131DEDBA|nr:alpha/beta hydrolase-fold protein [Amycolatopsis anabasis]